MRSILPLALLAAIPLLPVAAARAEPLPGAFAGLPPIRFQYYRVHGRTEAQIFSSLQSSGLGEQGNATTTGLTQWRADFHWETERGPGICRIVAPKTVIEVVVTLPRLADPDRATPEGLAAWRRYRAVIERHEAGHARIAFAHTHDFERVAAGASCDDIKAISTRVTDNIAALEEDYDRRTNHGQAQGNIVE